MKSTIITHPGRAHRDDFLAVCWLLGDITEPPAVFRREPSQEDLDDSTVYVLDIGGQHDPLFRNFDHHQLTKDHPPTCALQLLLEYDLGKEQAHQAFPWLFTTGLLDSKGPGAAAAHYGVPVDLFGKGNSPVESLILGLFSEVFLLSPGDALHTVMTGIGMAMWERAKGFGEAAESVKADILMAGSVVALVAVPETVTGLSNPNYLPEVMEIKRKEAAAQGYAPVVSITPNIDSRGPGWTIYRYDDNPKIDLQRIAGSSLVTFVHANGFIAKVVPEATLYDLLQLVKYATT
jgi:hypothetical protein